MIKALKKMFGFPETPKIPEMEFPEEYPEFDEMWLQIMNLNKEFTEANPLYFLEGTAKVYMGINQYKLYLDYFYNNVCFYSYRPDPNICVLPIEQVKEQDYLIVGL